MVSFQAWGYYLISMGKIRGGGLSSAYVEKAINHHMYIQPTKLSVLQRWNGEARFLGNL